MFFTSLAYISLHQICKKFCFANMVRSPLSPRLSSYFSWTAKNGVGVLKVSSKNVKSPKTCGPKHPNFSSSNLQKTGWRSHPATNQWRILYNSNFQKTGWGSHPAIKQNVKSHRGSNHPNSASSNLQKNGMGVSSSNKS